MSLPQSFFAQCRRRTAQLQGALRRRWHAWHLPESVLTRLPRGRLLIAALALAGTVVLVLVGSLIAAASMPTPLPKFEALTRDLPVPGLPEAPKTATWQQEMTQAGDDYRAVLTRLNIPAVQIDTFINTNPLDNELKRFKPGQAFSVQLSPSGEMVGVQYFSDDDDGERNLVSLEKKDGRWLSSPDKMQAKTLPVLREVVVRTSARGALAQAEVPVDIRETVNDTFGKYFSLNDLVPGDSIRLYYDNHYYRGEVIGTGDIHAISITHNGTTYQAYYFGNEGSATFYDDSGKALKQGFSLKPVGDARVSSPFGMRLHPVLGTFRMHTGIDYAVPTGTPIHAPADGVIVESGAKGGYGLAVAVQHPNGILTLYGHLSAFVSGLHVGSPVSTGQVIGFVGTTGRSTGPHLHYEVRINGEPVNPATVALPAPPIAAAQMQAFNARKAAARKMFALLPAAPVTVAQTD